MKRRDFLTLAGAAATAPAWPLAGLAQVPAKVPRIVLLSNGLPDDRRLALFQGLADHGYIDGKNIVVDILTAPTIADVPAYAARAVASKPDLILTIQSSSPLAVKALTTTIPVVFATIEDPVAIGLVANYAHPGGNLTGYMTAGPDVIGKQVQIIHEVMPTLSRIAFIGLPADPPYPVLLAQVRAGTKALNIETVVLEAREGEDFVPLFDAAMKNGAQAIHVVSPTYLTTLPNVAVLAELALRYRLPSFGNTAGARSGMMIGYGSNVLDVARRAGFYVDAILKGAKPGDLPVVQPTAFDLVVNLKTAKSLGVTIPQSILFQATEVIA